MKSLPTTLSDKQEAHIITHIQQHVTTENLQVPVQVTRINMATSVLQCDRIALTLNGRVIARTRASKWNLQNTGGALESPQSLS
jgi:ribosomal protein S3